MAEVATVAAVDEINHLTRLTLILKRNGRLTVGCFRSNISPSICFVPERRYDDTTKWVTLSQQQPSGACIK